MSHALLGALHRAAVEGVLPFPRTRDATERWLNTRASSAPVHIVALGKAAPGMAAGALRALGTNRVTCAGGLVVAAHRPDAEASEEAGGQLPDTLPIRVGDHPLPDIGSLAAADAIADTVGRVQAGDDVLVLLSGGTTSLCAAPCAELVSYVGHPADAQAHIAAAVQTMLSGGLAIHEMNAIRRRLLRWGAGRLATAIHARGARLVQVLAISDVVGDDPTVIGSAPCTADPLHPDMLLALCDAHGLRDRLDPVIAGALGIMGASGRVVSPPRADHAAFTRVSYTVVARNIDARRAMADAARSVGIQHIIDQDAPLSGDAEPLGGAIAHAAVRVAERFPDAMLLTFGGEPTVNMLDERRLYGDADEHFDAPAADFAGTLDPLADDAAHDLAALLGGVRVVDTAPEEAPFGGRMQATALAAALVLEHEALTKPDARRITLLAAGTDGRDGPTDAAGAVVDGRTATRIRRAGRDPARDLQRLRSYYALDAAQSLLRTGPTGTNVMDVVAVYIAAASSSSVTGDPASSSTARG